MLEAVLHQPDGVPGVPRKESESREPSRGLCNVNSATSHHDRPESGSPDIEGSRQPMPRHAARAPAAIHRGRSRRMRPVCLWHWSLRRSRSIAEDRVLRPAHDLALKAKLK